MQIHGTIMSVALHPTDPNQVYIGARYQGEVFGTQDGGKTWTALPLPGPVKDIYAGRVRLSRIEPRLTSTQPA